MFKNKNDGRNNLCGDNIKRLRLAYPTKLSQKGLADKMQLIGIDIDKNAIQRIECGKRFVTDIEIVAFSNVFEVKYEDLLNVVSSEMWGKESKNIKCRKAVYEYIEIIKSVIKEGIENGEFYDGDVEALAAGIFGVTYSSLIYRLKKHDEIDIKKV